MDRLAVSVGGLLVCLAVWTAWQVPMWASDEALWRRAVVVNTRSPRPAYNLGLALRKQGRFYEAAEWFTIAVDRYKVSPQRWDYPKAVAWQLAMIEQSGAFVCDSPLVHSYCYPEP